MSDVLILCYHAVSERWPDDIAVTSHKLRRQLEFVVGLGYRGATFHEAVTAPKYGRTVAVTFDDAFLSVAELAYPILESLRLPGTVFAVTDFADEGQQMLSWDGIRTWSDTEHRAELRGLTWSQLGVLADSGWEIGSHTRTHPRLTALDDEALAEELVSSRAVCERALGRPCLSLAYPYGDVDERVVTAARAAGYEAAGTLPRDLSDRRHLSTPRVGVYRGDSLLRFRLKVSPGIRRLRTTWSAVRRTSATR